jgi:alkylated DNA repair dioxygenase AlkB
MSFPSPEALAMPDAEVLFYPSLFAPAESDDLFQQLSTTIEWEQRHINLPVGKVPLPRLTAWYGDAGKSYTYSGMTFYPHEWTPQLLQIKHQVEHVSGVQFNSVLLNLYRHEQDSVSWHSDDEPDLGKNPVIASVSLGSVRPFQF